MIQLKIYQVQNGSINRPRQCSQTRIKVTANWKCRNNYRYRDLQYFSPLQNQKTSGSALSKYKYFQCLKSYFKDSIRLFIFVIATDDAININKVNFHPKVIPKEEMEISIAFPTVRCSTNKQIYLFWFSRSWLQIVFLVFFF